jgi:hypothetical protein
MRNHLWVGRQFSSVSRRGRLGAMVLAVVGVTAISQSAHADDLLTWQQVGAFPSSFPEMTSIVSGNYMYAIAHNVGSTTQLYYSPLSDLTNWTSAGSLSAGHSWEFALATSGNYLYAVGGQSTSTTNASSIVQYTVLNPTTGAPGPWLTTSSLAQSTYNASAIAFNDYLYAVGGMSSSAVQYAHINADGSLGSWNLTSSLNVARPLAALTISGGQLYAIGGGANSYMAPSSEFAAVNTTTGALGTWQTPQALPGNRSGAAAISSGNSVYLIGGHTGTTGSSPTNSVLSTTIQSNHTLGSWSSNTSIPNTHDPDVRTNASLVGSAIYVRAGDKVYRSYLGNASVVQPGVPAKNPIFNWTSAPEGPEDNQGLLIWNGSEWKNSGSVNTTIPTIVITHGWWGSIPNDGPKDTEWSNQLAQKLADQAPPGGANILAFDWRADSPGVSNPQIHSLATDIGIFGLATANRSAQRGYNSGKVLGEDLMRLNIDPTKLQLIGHSAGGAVVGGAIEYLAARGKMTARATLLDAPDLFLGEIPQADVVFGLGGYVAGIPPYQLLTWANALQYVNDANAVQVENYFSNGIAGRSAGGFGATLKDNGTPNIFNGRLNAGSVASIGDFINSNIDHFRVRDWYMENATGSQAGIAWSILANGTASFTTGSYTETGYETHDFGIQGSSPSLTPSASAVSGTSTVLANFQKISEDTFETGSIWAGQNVNPIGTIDGYAMYLHEGSDSFLFKEMTLSSDAQVLTFDFQVHQSGDGDYFTVSFENEVLFFDDLSLSGTELETVLPIFIGDFAGQTGTLLFTIHSTGTANASALIDNVAIYGVPEPASLLVISGGAMVLLIRRRRSTLRACPR